LPISQKNPDEVTAMATNIKSVNDFNALDTLAALLGFVTVLTLIVVPVLYAFFSRVSFEKAAV
jgi:hypothetical protein